ncbi:MAG TPA: hypothetical protein VJ781_09905 [Pyrinomonadaceae bacterium]|nr:hypothetical protein [Pyrinomonadaceae bacterium]
MNAITERPAFREAAQGIPNLSALNGVKLAVAVTGFETKEQAVTEENSVLNFTPRFVAVLETNAWNYQAIKFTEEKLGSFIDDIYGGEVLLETSDRHDGKYFVWTAEDGRKAYGLVQGSVVYFGNDESSIEKSLAVKRGEVESISNNPKVTRGDRLAFGYVSPDGVAQIANIAGLSLAKQSSEEGEVQSFVAGVLPEILRNSLKEATWTATKSDEGIVDSFTISMNPEVAAVLNETLIPSRKPAIELPQLVLEDAVSVTRYHLQDPQVAWRSLVLSAGKTTDPASGSLIVNFSDGLFEPYGIEDPEKFLRSVEPELFTVRFDEGGENVVVVAKVKDLATFEQSIANELRTAKAVAESADLTVKKSADGELMLATKPSGVIYLGDTGSVEKLVRAPVGTGYKQLYAKRMFESDALSATTGADKAAAAKIVSLFAEAKGGDTAADSRFLTETRFSKNGIERRTVSDFGVIGWIASQLANDE